MELKESFIELANKYESVVRGSVDNFYMDEIYRANNDNAGWPFIPANMRDFIRILDDFGDAKGKSFLDIGSGPGTKVLTAKLYSNFKHAAGLELNKNYCNNRTAFDINIINKDLFTFKDYCKYDCLYSFMPIRNPDVMDNALERIVKQMKKEAVLYFIPAGSSDKSNRILSKFTRLQTCVCYKFVKQ